MMASLLIQTDIVNSFRLLLFFLMTLPLLREYLRISWPFPLPWGMSQQRRSLAYFKVRLLWLGLTVFG